MLKRRLYVRQGRDKWLHERKKWELKEEENETQKLSFHLERSWPGQFVVQDNKFFRKPLWIKILRLVYVKKMFCLAK